MKYIIAILIGVILLALAACGGGDGSGGGSSDDDSSTPPPVTIVEPDEPDDPTTAQDLVVPEGFDYNPVKPGTLSVDISGFSTQRAQLSLYKQFSEDNAGNYRAHYPSKAVSVPLTSGKVDFDFNVSDIQKDLLVEIWFYDGSEPIKRVISVNDTSLKL
ncbi:hypothetical protein [Vibrio campbellii]|uniref:Lipoprotein n=1 Tax=Vibrio campbellii (strain ATCC BAA-1116) TaxID=2902295 RepID=A7N5A0_VIBC1|nr:hypothetical protein [Vibrio campbellii]ABU73898.1 hypothetical protein VIBHAR_06005 [Vibrio campbellii ATCC BAA-1116]AGU97445.1 hypothetical protein M892_21835 [Vibrio campbellii ATCC BAA-1116]MBT0123754.1 hypothetical protein [Vibrio campbellii]MBT0138745.1 hypothetical protein [Vibrio campbellii]MBT0143405.1 hypothetical protein [Vibrio campbellii]